MKKNITLVYYGPGLFMPEDYYKDVDEINPTKHVKELPDRAYKFYYMYNKVVIIEDIEYISASKKTTRHYHIDALLLNKEMVEELNTDGHKDTLLSNMDCNDWDYVIKERTLNFQPYDSKKDVFIRKNE